MISNTTSFTYKNTKKVLKWFESVVHRGNKFLFVIFFVIVQLIISNLFGAISRIIDNTNALIGPDFSNLTNVEIFAIAVIIVPLIETFVFQYGIIKLVTMIFKKEIIGIVISAVFFAISHLYNWLYLVNMLFVGLVFGYSFVVAKRRNWPAFYITFFIHSLYNAYVFIERVFFF